MYWLKKHPWHFSCNLSKRFDFNNFVRNIVLRKKLVPCGTDGRLLLSGFQAVVTLTLTLDRVIRHTVVYQLSTSYTKCH